MSELQVFLADVVVLATAATLLGLLRRGRYRLCWSFTAYASAVVVSNRLVVWWPEQFYTKAFWALKSAAFALLVFLIALELASMVFQAFPGSRPALRTAFLLLLGITALGAFWVAPGTPRHDYFALLNHLQPRVILGAGWLFAAMAGLTHWYRIPLHDFHRDLLTAFTVDAVSTGLLWSLISSRDTGVDVFLRCAYQVASIAVALFWARAAWRREAMPDAPPSLIRELQPWRH